VKDAAEVRQMNASALRQLIDGGFNPDAAVAYMASGDLARLKGKHSGLVSVQLLPPGTTADKEGTPPSADSDAPDDPARALNLLLEGITR
jgi:hypothetical protein